MGCTSSKTKKEKRFSEKNNASNFWEGTGTTIGTNEQTISSIENIRYYYVFDRRLGKGSFGFVYKAHAVNDVKRIVAIKSIKKNAVQGAPAQYLRREVEIIKSMDHPNICKFYETFMDHENIYLVMEYCAGGTLREKLQQKNFNESEIACIMEKLFWAVNYMHTLGIVHRDLKLDNVIFTGNENEIDIKLIDFGLAKRIEIETKRKHTKVGSFYFMAPEVISHNRYDEACDIWSLGVIMYTLFTGQYPFYEVEDIQNSNIRFDQPLWNMVSKESKSLIKSLLTPLEKDRIRVKQALDHAWFTRLRNKTLEINKIPRVSTEYSTFLERLINFKASSSMKKEVLIIIVNMTDFKDSENHKKMFKKLDSDKNGIVTANDLRKMLYSQGLEDQIGNVQKIIRKISLRKESSCTSKDMMSSSQLKVDYFNYSEFLAATLDEKEYLNQKFLQQVFKYLNASESGHLSKQDIKDIMAREGRKLPESEIDYLYQEMMTISQGKNFNFQHFCQLMEFDPDDEIIEQNGPSQDFKEKNSRKNSMLQSQKIESVEKSQKKNSIFVPQDCNKHGSRDQSPNKSPKGADIKFSLADLIEAKSTKNIIKSNDAGELQQPQNNNNLQNSNKISQPSIHNLKNSKNSDK